MGIFRGIGGTGNSTDDGVVDAVTAQAVIATNKATEAATSATSAYNSAQSASTSKDTAITQANAAQSSANTASTHATNASTSATSAATSATSATASATTATTKASEAATSATNAATSETNAATSATTATTKASEAATSATTATTKAGEASTSATNAASSATSASTSASTATTKASEASTSAANAASSYDDFDDRYLGAKSSAPTVDNDGDALITGALYFDTSSNAMKVYSGSSWLDAYASLSGALIATNNLSDLNNVSTARTNLGLGTAATTDASAYATAAQADQTVSLTGAGATSISGTYPNFTITSTDTNTTYSVGDGGLTEINFTSADNTKLDAINQGVATTDSPSFAGLTVDTNTLYVDSTNNRVGIGTTSPTRTFHSKGASGISTTGKFEAGGSQVYIQLSSTGQADGDSGYIGYDSSKNLTLFTDNTERMRIDSSGKVGIGTTSPSAEVEIVSGGAVGLKVNHDNFQQGIVSYRNHATNSASLVFENASGRTGTLYNVNNFPYWRDGTTTNSHAIWTAGNDGSGSGLDADLLDGQEGSYYAAQSNVETYINRSYVDKHDAANLAVGWYTIAQNTGNRAVARFALWDVNSGDHQSVVFYAAHHYGTDASNTITVLHNSKFSGSPFRYLRIKDAGTYDGAALQVYIDDAFNAVNVAIVGDDVQTDGWNIVDFLPDATAPSEVSNWSSFTEKSKIDLDLIDQGGIATTGAMYADGDTTQYKVLTTNDYSASGNRWGVIAPVGTDGVMEVGRYIDFHETDGDTSDKAIRLDATSTRLRLTTGSGYVDLGAQNTSYSHFNTDRGKFFFNKRLIVDEGIISSYNEDIEIQRQSSAYSYLRLDSPTGLGGRLKVVTNSYSAGFQTRSFFGTTMFALSNTTDNSAVDGIAYQSSRFFPARSNNTSLYLDNVADCGHPSARWDDVYATNGTIQTSDEREKQDIEALSEAEQRVAVAAKGLLRKFRWKDKVEAKGDDARIHFGIIAQDLEAAFIAEGLDPSKYAMFIKTEWWVGDKVYPAIAEETDDEGNVTVEGREESTDPEHHYDNQADAPSDAVYHYRMGIRYSELLAFIISAI